VGTTHVDIFFESDRGVHSGSETPSALVDFVNILGVDVLSGIRDGFNASVARHVDWIPSR
jgi:hypothetical protein